MNVTATLETPHTETAAPVDTDVLIVGAGISGIGAAVHLQQQCPWASFTIFEVLENYGGTWLTHKYPGIRSDSDLYTFGYRFKPWVGPPIATAAEILKYMGEVIDEHDLAPHIHYRHRIDSAEWSTADRRWTVRATNLETGETVVKTARFVWMCQGYYRHAKGYTPEWPGMADYKGTIVHPQHWPEDLDYKGKRVAVIGSGATAATLVPAIAGDTAHVTLVQRSPTYFFPDKNANELADYLRKLEVDEHWVHEIVRRDILQRQEEMTARCLSEPEVVKAELLEAARAYLGPDFDIATHFTPRYRPWQQRLAFIPDGDLFVGLATGKASVETSEIERFTEKGLKLANGHEVEADIIVTATGFNLCVDGDIAFSVDGQPKRFADTVTWRGMMFTGIPNLVWIMGYFRASWTLRVDLVGDVVCKLLNHMHDHNRAMFVPRLPAGQENALGPWIDESDFNPGYLKRGAELLPHSGPGREWRHTQDCWRERQELPALDPETPSLAWG
jgi:cation diffusion facilitator CzcD-associated flavoprotein CzcO